MTVYINYIDKTNYPPNWDYSYIRKFVDVGNYEYNENTNTLWLTCITADIRAMVKIKEGMYFTVHLEED